MNYYFKTYNFSVIMQQIKLKTEKIIKEKNMTMAHINSNPRINYEISKLNLDWSLIDLIDLNNAFFIYSYIYFCLMILSTYYFNQIYFILRFENLRLKIYNII